MWRTVKGEAQRKRYRCKCGNQGLFVVKEPVARKVHTREAKRKRIAAECPACGRVKRVAWVG